MGCLSRLSFGAVTLEHYINASLIMLPENRNLYILTDDVHWLEPHLRSYHARARDIAPKDRFTFFVNAASPWHREASSDASAEFWASIKLAQQCQAFAGHFSSVSTILVHNAMCYRHSFNNYLQCPPMMLERCGRERAARGISPLSIRTGCGRASLLRHKPSAQIISMLRSFRKEGEDMNIAEVESN